jgi:hypothetical protein
LDLELDGGDDIFHKLEMIHELITLHLENKLSNNAFCDDNGRTRVQTNQSAKATSILDKT